jgi:hypothetical protein
MDKDKDKKTMEGVKAQANPTTPDSVNIAHPCPLPECDVPAELCLILQRRAPISVWCERATCNLRAHCR